MPSQGDVSPVVTMQSDVELPDGVTIEALTALAAHVLLEEDVRGEWPLGVRFIDDAAMQAAHVEFMGIDEPTDIMTFPYGDDEAGDDTPWIPEEGDDADGRGGDLLISVDRAAENASDAGWSTERELYFLVAHGILHLLGWDDATDADRSAMLDRQAELINGWNEAPGAMP